MEKFIEGLVFGNEAALFELWDSGPGKPADIILMLHDSQYTDEADRDGELATVRRSVVPYRRIEDSTCILLNDRDGIARALGGAPEAENAELVSAILKPVAYGCIRVVVVADDGSGTLVAPVRIWRK